MGTEKIDGVKNKEFLTLCDVSYVKYIEPVENILKKIFMKESFAGEH